MYVDTTQDVHDDTYVRQVIFETLPDAGMDRMTAARVEFVLCASALTAQV